MPDTQVGGRSHMVVRAIVAGVLGTWLIWQIVAAGLAGLATRSRDARLLAAIASPSHPQAASLFAQSLFAAGDDAAAARLARSVVLVDPTNDQALRVLGLATERKGEKERGASIMRQAAMLGWRDTPTQLWVLRDAALRNDAVMVIQRADALARRNRSGNLTRAIFFAAITDPSLRAAFIDSLARQPVWRGFFFADVRERLPASSMNAMEALFREMRARHLPVDPSERLNYIYRLVDLGQFGRARNIWAGSFGILANRLTTAPYDADFALAAVRSADSPVSPFDWQINPDLTGTVTFSDGPAGSSLAIPASIIGGTTIASQLLILTPGRHDLSARIGGSAGTATAGWSITCLPSKIELPRRLLHGSDDELSSVSFDVPAQGCGGQRLALVARDRLDAQPVTIANVVVR